MDGSAIVLTNGHYKRVYGKTCHGLVRGTSRYNILGVVDNVSAGQDAGELLDGVHRGIPIYATLEEALEKVPSKPDFCILGFANHGGVLPKSIFSDVQRAIKLGMSIVNGLHQYLSEDEELKQLAKDHGVSLIDIRKPKPVSELHFLDRSGTWDQSAENCRIGNRLCCREADDHKISHGALPKLRNQN